MPPKLDASPATDSTPQKKLEFATRSRGGHKANITRTLGRVAAIRAQPASDITDDELKALEQACITIEHSLAIVNQKAQLIERLLLDVDGTKLDDEMEEAAAYLVTTQHSLNQLFELITEKNTPAIATTLTSSDTTATGAPRDTGGQLRLPKIDMPTFAGDYCQWTSFMELFNATVHENQTREKDSRHRRGTDAFRDDCNRRSS